MKLIAVGDNVVDYYQDQETFYPGGNALNVAVLAKRLGHESSYIGIVGNDEAAAHLLNVLKLEQVNADYIRQAHGENGMAIVTLDEQGTAFLSDQIKAAFSPGFASRFRRKMYLLSAGMICCIRACTAGLRTIFRSCAGLSLSHLIFQPIGRMII